MSCFWRHKWSQWSPVQKIIFKQTGESSPFKGTTIFKEPIIKQVDRQERSCVKCGKVEYNILRE